MSTIGTAEDGVIGPLSAAGSGRGIEARFTTSLPAQLFSQRVRDVVTDDRRFRLERVGVSSLELVSKVNLISWGSRITVSWTEAGEDVEVAVRAAARLRTALGDHGQARRDLARLRASLQRSDQVG